VSTTASDKSQEGATLIEKCFKLPSAIPNLSLGNHNEVGSPVLGSGVAARKARLSSCTKSHPRSPGPRSPAPRRRESHQQPPPASYTRHQLSISGIVEQRRVFCCGVLVFIVYLLAVSGLFAVMTEWDYFTSFYFLFNSVALIGERCD